MAESMLTKAARALLRTWETIAADLFACLEHASGETVKSMSRDAVVEVVLDANYLEMYGGSEETAKWIRSLDESGDQFKALIKKAFPYERYT
jgi:hypothetical protein